MEILATACWLSLQICKTITQNFETKIHRDTGKEGDTYRENTYGEATAKQLEAVIALRFSRALLLKSTISVKLPKLLGIGTL